MCLKTLGKKTGQIQKLTGIWSPRKAMRAQLSHKGKKLCKHACISAGLLVRICCYLVNDKNMSISEVVIQSTFFKLFDPNCLTATGEELGHPMESHINYLDKSKSSPLHLAVRGGNVEAIRFCIASGGKVAQQQVHEVQSNLNSCTRCSGRLLVRSFVGACLSS